LIYEVIYFHIKFKNISGDSIHGPLTLIGRWGIRRGRKSEGEEKAGG